MSRASTNPCPTKRDDAAAASHVSLAPSTMPSSRASMGLGSRPKNAEKEGLERALRALLECEHLALVQDENPVGQLFGIRELVDRDEQCATRQSPLAEQLQHA